MSRRSLSVFAAVLSAASIALTACDSSTSKSTNKPTAPATAPSANQTTKTGTLAPCDCIDSKLLAVASGTTGRLDLSPLDFTFPSYTDGKYCEYSIGKGGALIRAQVTTAELMPAAEELFERQAVSGFVYKYARAIEPDRLPQGIKEGFVFVPFKNDRRVINQAPGFRLLLDKGQGSLSQSITVSVRGFDRLSDAKKDELYRAASRGLMAGSSS